MQLVQLLALSAASYAAEIRGVSPQDQYLYLPDSDGFFHCVSDPSIKIPFDRVNDDFCDCPDGSDEPGTAACSNGKFYCVGSQQYIPSRLVGDGACDYDWCCDGSDEAPGLCEDRCAEVRAKQEAEKQKKLEFLREGNRLKQAMLSQAQTRKQELKQSIETLNKQILEWTPQLENLRAELHAAEAQKAKSSENSAASEALQIIRDSMLRADSELEQYHSQIDEYKNAYIVLERALAKMSQEYNPNFNDPAVKEAIKQWASVPKPNSNVAYPKKYSRDDLLEEIEESVGDGSVSCDVASCSRSLIGSLKLSLERIWSALLSGAVSDIPQAIASSFTSSSSGGALRVQRLRESFDGLSQKLEDSRKTLKLNEKLFSLGEEFWGKDMIGHSAENLCVSKKRGDFTYEVCLFGTAVQVNGPNHVQLGASKGLKQDANGQYYIDFLGGNACPNGVNRSVKLLLECGHNTEAFFVEEPEICSYQVKARSPIACDPVQEDIVHDEL